MWQAQPRKDRHGRDMRGMVVLREGQITIKIYNGESLRTRSHLCASNPKGGTFFRFFAEAEVKRKRTRQKKLELELKLEPQKLLNLLTISLAPTKNQRVTPTPTPILTLILASIMTAISIGTGRTAIGGPSRMSYGTNSKTKASGFENICH